MLQVGVLPLLGPATSIGQSANTLGVLPQVAILGTLAFGFPTTGLDGRFEAVDSGWAELDVRAGDVVAGHDGGGVFVPDGAEHVEAKGGEAELVAEGLDGEAVAGGVCLLEFGDVNGLAGLLFEEDDGEAVVRGTFLREGGQPGQSELRGVLDAAEGEGGVVGAEGDVGGEEVAAFGEGVAFGVGDVGVDDCDGH